MDIIIYIALLIGGCVLGLLIKPAGRYIIGIGKFYIALALVVSISLWLFYFAGIKNVYVQDTLGFVIKWGSITGHLLLGYLIVNAWAALKTWEIAGRSVNASVIISLTLWAATITTANAFIVATVGKAENMSYMEAFFKQSGYANWFLYFIMAAESLGGLGILLHSKLKTGPLAAAGIMIIMLGAVYTHWHNNDPFSDSYAAVSQLITLTMLQVLYYLQRRATYLAILSEYEPLTKSHSNHR